MIKDEENLTLADSPESVDSLNAQFYSRFPFPWRPFRFDRLLDPYFETIMLNQDLGDWQHNLIPKTPKIWVAGCGTNQAIFTALKFPKATVLGSDLSEKSLEIANQTAKELGLSNLQLKQESLNNVTYDEQFDYIICTGVIHHNANPQTTLARLATALKSRGILELMVYNRFHRITTSTFQKAVRILLNEGDLSVDFESELPIALKLVNGGFSTKSLMASFLREYRDGSEAKLADTLIQPVEHSYTVESLNELVTRCGLELMAPRINPFDTARNAFSWTMDFNDAELQELYHSLPDASRWQVTNLLQLEESPMLWFYVQRQDCNRLNKSESSICEEFLQKQFVKTKTVQKSYLLEDSANYKLSSKSTPFPFAPSDPLVRKVLEEIDEKRSMAEIFESLDINTDFQSVNKMRMQLTTSAFPYLRAIQPGANSIEDKKLAMTSLNKLNQIRNQTQTIKPRALGNSSTKIIHGNASQSILSIPADEVLSLFKLNGLLLFRGFGTTYKQMLAFSEQFSSGFVRDPARQVVDSPGGSVQLVDNGMSYVPPHCENAVSPFRPDIVWFCCAVPAVEGGETLFWDGLQVWEELSEQIRQIFSSKKIKFIFDFGIYAWKRFLGENATIEDVERELEKFEGVNYSIKDDLSIHMEYVCPAVVKTRFDGKPAFANSIISSMTSPKASFQRVTFEDGSPIPDVIINEINAVLDKMTGMITWQSGDLVMIDNSRFLHGRKEFKDTRRKIFTHLSYLKPELYN